MYLTLWHTAPQFDPAGTSAYSILMLAARRELIGPLCSILFQNQQDTTLRDTG